MTQKSIKLFLFLFLTGIFCFSGSLWADTIPTRGQKAMIARKYGMFLHFGMNTYLNAEWSDGSAPASTFNPPADIAKRAEQWVKNAKEVGMRSIVLTTKHHDGFCLWNSRYTDYDIANKQIKNKVDIVKAVSSACKKYGIAFSVYYSLWDRHEPCYKDKDKHKYIVYMENQLRELMTKYGKVNELWFDGGWDRKVQDWYLPEVYRFVKKLQPDCQIATNWTIGKHPVDMRKNDSIIYFPSDFRLWDPYLPVKNDPKIYSYNGKKYYLPYESTQTISILGNWFNHPKDLTVRDTDELEEIFYTATQNNNCLLLNIPPDTNGVQNPQAIDHIKEMAKYFHFENGKPFPKMMKKPISLTYQATAQASSIQKSDSIHFGAQYAIDNDVSTSWVCGQKTGWLEISLAKSCQISKIQIIEGQHNIKKSRIEIFDKNKWIPIYQDSALSNPQQESFMGYGYGYIYLPKKITTDKLRIHIITSAGIPSIFSVRLK